MSVVLCTKTQKNSHWIYLGNHPGTTLCPSPSNGLRGLCLNPDQITSGYGLARGTVYRSLCEVRDKIRGAQDTENETSKT